MRSAPDLQVSEDATRLLEKNRGKASFKEQLMFYQAVPNDTDEDQKYYSWRVLRLSFIVATSTIFETFITICIILNTFCLALDRYPDPP